MDRLIMTFHIEIAPGQISEMKNEKGGVIIIPFTGNVESDLFTGTILPGAADVQTTDAAGCRHMCAKYMFRGRDREENECYLYVENNGYFRPDQPSKEPLTACPRFLTDSPALAEYLESSHFRTEVWPSGSGVDIRVFDILLNEADGDGSL